MVWRIFLSVQFHSTPRASLNNCLYPFQLTEIEILVKTHTLTISSIDIQIQISSVPNFSLAKDESGDNSLDRA